MTASDGAALLEVFAYADSAQAQAAGSPPAAAAHAGRGRHVSWGEDRVSSDDGAPVTLEPQRAPVSHCYPQNHAGRGWGIRNRAMGAVRLPKILVLTIDDSVSGSQLGPVAEEMSRLTEEHSEDPDGLQFNAKQWLELARTAPEGRLVPRSAHS